MNAQPRHLLLLLAVATSPSLEAANFALPVTEDSVVGEPQETRTRYEDTLVDIARRYSLGFDEIRHANPGVDSWLPGEGTQVILPTRFILPDAPREGLVINVAEMRMYYYPRPIEGQPATVITYPISIGRGDWQTPLTTTKITAKVKNPTWYPPESVRKEHAAEGDPLPKAVPPGPKNPLGGYALRMGLDSYLIHGTNKPFGIGMQVTHGCIRLYPEEIEALFNEVPVGTPVRIINQPFKAGWRGDELYLEVHAPLAEGREQVVNKSASGVDNLTPVVSQVIAATQGRAGYEVDWDKVQAVVDAQAGIPVSIMRNGVASPPAGTSVAQTEISNSTSAQ